jgi:L,D-transpeptidase ErfK/SrfK
MRFAPEHPPLSTRARRGLVLGPALSALIVALASGLVGCADIAPSPKPAPKKEPYLLLKLSERKVYVMDDQSGQPSQGFPVAIGRAQWPTPTGKFQVNEMVENPDFLVFDFNNTKGRDRGRIAPGITNPLGLRWIGFASAYGWAVGFHGTQKTEVLGQAVSHGCVRMSNPDIVKMYGQIKVGTPVVVEP